MCALPPRSASSPLRRRRRPRTKWESSRFSSTIPGAPLSSSASLLRLLLPSPWLCPRNPPLRSPPVISRLLLRLFTGGNGPCAPASSRLLSPCVLSLSPCRRAIGFLHLTSAYRAGSFGYGGAAGEAWLQGSADAGWSVRSGIIEDGKGGGTERERRDGCCCSSAVPTPRALRAAGRLWIIFLRHGNE